MSGEATFLKRWPPRFSMGGDCRILGGCVGWFRRPLVCGVRAPHPHAKQHSVAQRGGGRGGVPSTAAARRSQSTIGVLVADEVTGSDCGYGCACPKRCLNGLVSAWSGQGGFGHVGG